VNENDTRLGHYHAKHIRRSNATGARWTLGGGGWTGWTHLLVNLLVLANLLVLRMSSRTS
jgi:hypothetical protein